MACKMEQLRPRKTLKGGFDAYCHVCWQAVYALWIDENDDPAGKCPNGHTRIEDCKEAMDWERMKGQIRKHLDQWHKENPAEPKPGGDGG